MQQQFLFGCCVKLYMQNHSNDLENSRPPTPAAVRPQLAEARQMLEDQNETDNFIPFSPVSTSTVVSLPPAVIPLPNTPTESAARKALRFMNMPTRARKYEAGAQRPETVAQFATVPTAPSSTFIYRDMPGTPRRLF